MAAARISDIEAAQALIVDADRSDTPHIGVISGLMAIAHGLLAVAGEIEALREHGIYRPEDGR